MGKSWANAMILVGHKDTGTVNNDMKIVAGIMYRATSMTTGFDPYLMIGPISDSASTGTPSISAEFYTFTSASSSDDSFMVESLVKNTRNKKIIGIGGAYTTAGVAKASDSGSILVYIHVT